ncbi:hypothetical protein [Serratia fonticola]|nr:hypothetical protein [Serratia fonticola]
MKKAGGELLLPYFPKPVVLGLKFLVFYYSARLAHVTGLDLMAG